MRCARAVSFALARLRSGRGRRGPGAGRAGLPAAAARRSSTSSTSRRPPEVVLSPSRDVVAVLEHAPMPTIAELSRPMLRLAGLRIDPATNGRHRARTARSLTLKAVADGAVRPVTLPPSPALTWLGFSADGARFAFTQTTADRHRAVDRRDARRAAPRPCPAPISTPCWRRRARGSAWAARCVCATTVPGRGAAPAAPAVPTGPNVQEHRGGVVAGAHLSGPAHLGARRSALRVLRHQPARDGGRGHRRAHAARAARAARAGAAVARRAVHAGHAAEPSPTRGWCRTTTSPRASRSGIASAPSPGRSPRCRLPTTCPTAACCPGRAASGGIRSSRRRWRGPKRSTAAIRRPRCRSAIG